MEHSKQYIVLRRHTWRRGTAILSLQEMAAECGLHPDLVQRFVTLGIIDPLENDASHFAPEAARRIRRLLRLRRDLGVNYNAAGLVLELLERIDQLEARLRQYEA
jgi:MerR family transcriptional regulator/heat shock protein HspR